MNGLRLHSSRLLRMSACFLVWIPCLLVIGCQSTRSATLESAISAYNTGSYQRAFDEARSARQSSTGPVRAESAYVAGLAAMKIDRPVTARTLLEEAAGSRDNEVSGRASASLGTLLLEDQEPLAAARAYDQAAARLTGADRVRAQRQAGLAYRKAGMTSLAEKRLADAGQMHSVLPGRFTIQGGFFEERTRAVKRAEDLSGLGRGLALGTARIVPTSARGTSGFAVQIGDFSNRTDAEMARRTLGDTKTFIAKVSEP